MRDTNERKKDDNIYNNLDEMKDIISIIYS